MSSGSNSNNEKLVLKSEPHSPYIGDEMAPPEITFRCMLLSAILAVVLSAANVYLGLFAGLTVSASIPAAVLSMAILGCFRDASILENNMVQTAASAGESLAAGVLFTIPALVLMNVQVEFLYTQTFLIALFGGALGVLFSIPLRRALIVEQRGSLPFPEGTATAKVLKAGYSGSSSAWLIVWPAIGGGLMKLADTGLTIWSQTLEGGWRAGTQSVFYLGVNLSPALIGVGYIVGIQTATIVLFGGLLNFLLAIPIRSAITGEFSNPVAMKEALTYWSSKTRYIGCGAMVVGGLWTLIKMRKAIWKGLSSGLDTYAKVLKGKKSVASDVNENASEGESTDRRIPRTEKDVPMFYVLIIILISLGPLFYIYYDFTRNGGISVFMCFFMIIFGFLFSSVAAYMAGVVGSSNNPISGVTICTILAASLFLRAFLGADSAIGPASGVLIASTVCCAAAISGDNMQDLKAGHLLGATPWKLQFQQIFGVFCASFVQQPILQLLLQAYGIGDATPEHPKPLSAPQAVLMAAVSSGVFDASLPWDMVGLGMGLAAIVIALDTILEWRRASLRIPVLAFAMGVYLPLPVQTAIFLGGLVSWFATIHNRHPLEALSQTEEREERDGEANAPRGGERGEKGRLTIEGESDTEKDPREEEKQEGLLFAGGLITGESLMGLFMAIPIVATGDPQVLSLVLDPPMWPGTLLIIFIMIWLYAVATSQKLQRVIFQLLFLKPCRNAFQRNSYREPDYSQL